MKLLAYLIFGTMILTIILSAIAIGMSFQYLDAEIWVTKTHQAYVNRS